MSVPDPVTAYAYSRVIRHEYIRRANIFEALNFANFNNAGFKKRKDRREVSVISQVRNFLLVVLRRSEQLYYPIMLHRTRISRYYY